MSVGRCAHAGDHACAAHIDDTLETAIDDAGLAMYACALPTLASDVRHPQVNKLSRSAHLLMTVGAVCAAVCAVIVYYYMFVFVE
jgi:hypothetical protein